MEGFLLLVGMVGFIFLVVGISEMIERGKGSRGRKSPAPPVNNARPPKYTAPPVTESPVIKSYMESLVKVVGINEKVDDALLIDKVADGKTKEVVEAIARQLRLPVSIRLHESQEARPGVLAEVKIPPDLPMWGLASLKGYPLNVTVYKGHDATPSRFIYVVAHELSHVVLKSLGRVDEDKDVHEKQTDLTVLLLGFATSFRLGKDTLGEVAGYLSANEVEYAYSLYLKMLAAKRAERRPTPAKKEPLPSDVVSAMEDVLWFDRRLKLLLSHPETKIGAEDTQEVSLLFVMKLEDEKAKEMKEALGEYKKLLGSDGDKEAFDKVAQKISRLHKNTAVPTAEDKVLLGKYTDKWVETV